MRFVRIFWGDINRYHNQIKEAKEDKLNEMVYVWGKENYTILNEMGYECYLINENSYDYTIASGHTFVDYRSLTHKIVGLKIALEQYKEVIFLDWDVRKVKELDDNFYDLIKSKGSSLQVPLYVYPSNAFTFLKESTHDYKMVNFFNVLENSIRKYAYNLGDNFILPNTGFIYCNDIKIADRLLAIIQEQNMESVPDELSVAYHYKNFKVNEYVMYIEPMVIGTKESGYDWWDNEEQKLMDYKKAYIIKDVYFKHK
jgi:hypothetical protein